MNQSISISTIVISVSLSILGSIIGWFSLRSKDKEYKNEYYKMVLQKRISAYQQLEAIVTPLNLYCGDGNGGEYHSCFHNNIEFDKERNDIFDVSKHVLWLSNEAFKKMKEIAEVFTGENLSAVKTNEDLQTLGKLNFKNLNQIHSDISKIIQNDMLQLYNIEKFLKDRHKKTYKNYSGFKEFQTKIKTMLKYNA